MIPKIKPSIINGCLIAKLLVPTNLFISISLRLENIVSLIVFFINALLIIKIELDAGYYECKNCKYNF